MGGSKETSTKTEPWKPQQGYLTDIFGRAQDYFDQSASRGPWSGDMYAPEDPRTGAARDAWYEMNRMNTGVANNAMNYTDYLMGRGANEGSHFINSAANTVDNYRFAQNFMSQNQGRDIRDQVNPWQYGTLGGPAAELQSILRGGQPTGNNVLDSLAAGTAPGGILGDTLSGRFMDPNNPILQNYMNAATRPVEENMMRNQLPGLDSQAILQGAYGGDANAVQRGQAIGDTNQAIADARSNILYQNMNAERDRQQQIGMSERNAQLSSAQNERNMQFQGLTNERGIEAANFQQEQNLNQQNRALDLQTLLAKYAQDSSNVFNAAGMEQARNQLLGELGTSSVNQGLSAAGMQPSLFQFAQMPYQNMSQIGDMFTGSGQRSLDNQRAMWDYPMQYAWDQLGNYQNMINGNYGSIGSSSGGGGSPLMGGLGGAALGGMAGGALGSGASGAALASMLGMSTGGVGLALPIAMALLGGGGGMLLS